MIKLLGYLELLVLIEIENNKVRLMGKLPTGEWIDGPKFSIEDAQNKINELRLNPYQGPPFKGLEELENFLFQEAPKEYEKVLPGASKIITPELVRDMYSLKKK